MTALRSVVVATRNAGKIRELLPILTARGISAETLESRGIAETAFEADLERFETFEENALAKARYFAEKVPGALVIADDSGIVVDALNGRPGVASKRWSARADLHGIALDEANNARLQQELLAVGALDISQRRARYVCAMAGCLSGEGGFDVVALGECEGHILLQPRGNNGFGYDPWFWSRELDAGFGEVTRELKASVSHRASALAHLLDTIEARVDG